MLPRIPAALSWRPAFCPGVFAVRARKRGCGEPDLSSAGPAAATSATPGGRRSVSRSSAVVPLVLEPVCDVTRCPLSINTCETGEAGKRGHAVDLSWPDNCKGSSSAQPLRGGKGLRIFPGFGITLFQNPLLPCAESTMFGRLTLPQLLFASLLGVTGGIYIYQPIFEQYSKNQQALKERAKLSHESEEKKS
ncbi:protein PIGBOS1 isoform X1 [Echinops telfairi]|uniref:Protein PIGBOS1 isoform X1 n=2 Tax=Echinops telfairi TaxID=9371 RepID=A0AC55CSH7_ECHTE|nr:protein PIGBOS1 isoform X1 [Echinops telfairi]